MGGSLRFTVQESGLAGFGSGIWDYRSKIQANIETRNPIRFWVQGLGCRFMIQGVGVEGLKVSRTKDSEVPHASSSAWPANPIPASTL